MDLFAARVVDVLDHEPRLVDGNRGGRELARRALRARALELGPGVTRDDRWGAELEPPPLGLLLIDGCMVCESPVGGRAALELLCPGDLLRPWEEPALIDETPASWRGLSHCTLAVLDGPFARRAAPWQEVGALLLSRLTRRSRNASLMLSIRTLPRVADRLLAVLWIIADRMGQVTADGVVVKLSQRQADRGELAGARLPTVNVTLKLLREGCLLRSWTAETFVLDLHAGEAVAERLARGGLAGASGRRPRRRSERTHFAAAD